jgi:hypothetical protein
MTQEKFAIYFPELSKERTNQTGYLWVKRLGAGIEGSVDLVLSVVDGQLYARKKTLPTKPASTDYHNREVFFHRQHYGIPKLISYADCKVLSDWHRQAEEIRATVMISQYCNGGTLASFSNCSALGPHSRRHLPESVLWQLFARHLETMTFLHNCTPSLGRMDSHMNNIWLHFPDESSKVPEFFCGDLGQLEIIDSDIWEPTPEKHRCLKALHLLRKVPKYSYYVRCLADDLNHVRINIDVVSNSEQRSPEFHYCQWLLSTIVHNMWKFCDWVDDGSEECDPVSGLVQLAGKDHRWYNKLEDLRKIVTEYAARGEEAGDNLSWARSTPTKPRLWVDRSTLLSDCKACDVPGPFMIVKVDPETLAISDMDNGEFGANNPQKLSGFGNTYYVGGWSREELVPDTLADQEIYRPEHDEDDTDNSDDEKGIEDDDWDENPPTSNVSDLLSRVPTLKRRRGCLVADFGGSWKHRNVDVRQVKNGVLVIMLGREDFVVRDWKDGRRKRITLQDTTKAKEIRGKPVWHRCDRKGRLRRIACDCVGEVLDCN